MASLERARIEEALRAEGWNISRAAARLGLPRNTLRYRMERHGLIEGGEGAPRRRSDSPAVRAGEDEAAQKRQRLHRRCDGSERASRSSMRRCSTPMRRQPEHERAARDRRHRAKGQCVRWPDHRVGPACVKAAFGLDLIEDAARHAAHAAFAVQRAVGASTPPLEVRIALHTEEMLVGRLEDRVELDADGRRAAQHVLDGILAISPGRADPRVRDDQALPGAAIRRRAARRRTGTAAGLARHRARGRRSACEPVRVTRPRNRRARGSACCRSKKGYGQAVLVAGDPGIGKTRLLHEFHRRTSGRAAWLQGSAVSFGRSLPFHPLIDLLKHAFSVQASDSDEVIGDRIDRTTAPFGEAYRPSVPFLRSLLSIDAGDSVARASSTRSFAARASSRRLRGFSMPPPKRARSSSFSRTCTGWIRRRANSSR